MTMADVCRKSGRSTSTISREIARNLRPTGYYAASGAHEYAIARRHKSRRGSQFSEEQWQIILFLLRLDFSPDQISNILKRFALFSISHETIYQYLLYDKKKGCSLYKHLRFVPKRRRKRYNSHDSRGHLDDKSHVSECPAYINNRSEVGHWEGDTVIGRDRHHCIVTLVERKTGFVVIKKISARTAEQVTAACIRAI